MQAPDSAPCPICAVALRPLAAVTGRHEAGGPRALALLRCSQCARHYVWEHAPESVNGARPGEERLLGPVASERALECLRLSRSDPVGVRLCGPPLPERAVPPAGQRLGDEEVALSARREMVLVLGGARSGKSAFAGRLASACGPRVLYVATGQPGDAEMQERIARHQAGRPEGWTTVEEPLRLPEAVARAQGYDAVVVDCLTLWVSNRLLAAEGQAPRGVEEALLADVARVVSRQKRGRGAATLILVSNEVGMGLVPPNPLGRAYRDLLGRVNQAFAEAADRVYLLVAGIAVDVKALPGAVLMPSSRPAGRGTGKRLYTTSEAERVQRLLESREARRKPSMSPDGRRP